MPNASMTLNVETPRVVYTGSGTRGPFSLSVSGTPITYSASSHIIAERYSDAGVLLETLVEGVDYDLSVTSVATGDSAATLTIDPTADVLASDERLVIYRSSPLSQTLALTQGGGFSSSANEANYDKIVRILQELNAELGRQITINPISSGIDVNLPVPAAGYVLGWNEAEDGFTNLAALATDTVTVSAAWADVINKSTIALGLTQAGFSTLAQNLRDDTTLDGFLTTLGVSTNLRSFIGAANNAAALTSLGVSTFIQTLIDDTSAAAARATLQIADTRNRVLNPDGRISQEAPASTADDVYAFDGWYVLTQTGAVAPSVLSNPENGAITGMRLTQSQVSAQRMGIAQILSGRDCQDLRGKLVSLLARVRLSTTATLRYAILEWTGTANSVTSDVVNDWTSSNYTTSNFFISSNVTLLKTGTVSCTANTIADLQDVGLTQGSSVNNVILFVWTEATAAQNVTLDLWNVDYYAGSAARTFEAPQYDAELRRAQRFLRFSGGGMGGGTASTTAADFPISWDDMIAAPTISQQDTAPSIRISGSTSADIAGTIASTAAQQNAAGEGGSGSALITFTRTSGTWTAGLPAFIAQTAPWLKLDARL